MNRDGLDPEATGTMTKACWVWFAFVAGLVLLGLIVMSLTSGAEVRHGILFVLAALWSVIAVPAMIVIKGHVIRAGWESRPADPETYYKGLLVVWTTIAIGVVLALIGCAVHGTTLPGGLLAGVLLTLLVGMKPSSAALGAGMTETPA